MSHAQMSIGCPNCDGRAVELAADDGELATDGGGLDPEFRDADRLTGMTVDCRNCGDEFEVYFY